MKKKISPLVLICLGFAFLSDPFILLKSISVSASFFTTDNLGNAYVVNGTVLEKYDADGNFLYSFGNKNLGNISLVDASNPLKTLVFYRPFQQFILLDNKFSPTGNPVSLEWLGYNQVSLICSSYNNGFWIFNKQNSELIRFDQSLQKTFQTANLAQVTGTEIDPVFLSEQNGKVFLSDTVKGIFVFDHYGTFHKIIPLKRVRQMQLDNEKIIFFGEGKLKSYHLKTFEESEISLPGEKIISVRTEKEKLYLLKQNHLEIYHAKEEKK